jgi:hypothetical protein
MRQDGVGANASVFEKGTRVTGRRPLAPKLEHAPRGNGRAQPFQSATILHTQ